MLAPPRPLEPTRGETCERGLPEALNLPLSLATCLRFTPEQFEALCWANREAVMELAADGSLLVALDRWQPLSPEQRRSFAPVCPDLVVELASPSDEGPRGITALRCKMVAYQRNGARLGWLLIPHQRAVEVWGPLAAPPPEPQRIEAASRLDGAPQFPGLVIALEEIWAV